MEELKDIITEANKQCDLDPMDELSNMVGINSVKDTLNQLLSQIEIDRERSAFGLPVNSVPLHGVFLGNKGLGKTRTVELLGKIFKNNGILSTGIVFFESADSLLGENDKEVKEKIDKIVERSQGGILYIYEASLLSGENEKKGALAISTLMRRLQKNQSKDWMVILSDEPNKMMNLLNANSLLCSKLPNYFYFENLSPEELKQIAIDFFDKNSYVLTEDALKQLDMLIRFVCKHGDSDSANAGYIKSLIKRQVLPSMAKRVMSQKEIRPEDLKVVVYDDLPSRAKLYIQDSVTKLKKKAGFSDIKKFKTDDHLNFVRFLKKRIDSGISTDIPPLHMIFAGDNFVEKVKIADYLASYYISIGLLSEGKVCVCQYQSLLGKDLSDTQSILKEKLEENSGNILIINIPKDLFSGKKFTSPSESIVFQNLWSMLGKVHNDSIIILSCMPNDMKSILGSGSELRLRFPYLSLFENYHAAELKEYLLKFAKKENFIFHFNNKYVLDRNVK
jgi:ATPase family associated with various cellular activities (AAA).